MTTQSIEEMVEHFFTTFSHIFPEDSKWTGQVDAADAGWIRGYLESALTQTHQAGIDEERKRLAGLIKPRAQKFINKVDKGLARSKETYKDMHYIVDLLDDTIKALQDNK